MSRLVIRPLAVLLVCLWAAGCRTATVIEGPSARSDRVDEKALSQRAEAQAHFAAGVIDEINDNAKDAYEEFYLAAKANPRDEELLVEVSNRLLEGRQFDRALEVLTWAAALPHPPDVVYVRLGFVYSQLGQNKKSIEANRVAIGRMPLFLPVRQNLYFNYLQSQRPKAALKVLDDAAAEPGTGAEFLINLAELYLNHARQFPEQRAQANGKALELLNRAGKMTPLEVPLQLKLADGLSLLGDTNGAVKLYLAVINQVDLSLPLRDILRAKLVDIFLRSNDHTRAVQQLNAILEDNPGNASAYYFLGSIAFEEKRWPEAIENYRRAILYKPDFEQAHYDLAAAQLAAGQGAEAVKTMEAVRRQFPARFANEYLSGVVYHERKQYAEALTHLKAAEAIASAGETNHLNAALYFQLGATSERAGARAEAESYFEKSIALAPDNAEACNYLGYMWAEKGEKLDRARKMIERALKLEPDNAAFLDSLGWVCFQQGQFRQAVDYLLKAIAAAPQEPDATVYDHLGDAYAALKDMDKAREAWAKSLSLEANDAVKKKLDAAGTR